MSNTIDLIKKDEKSSIIPNTKILTSHRTKSRKLLFQELYAMSFNKFDSLLFRESFFDNVFTFKQDDEYILEMQKIITYYESFFIHLLKIYTPKFNINNMSLSYILPIYIWLAEMFFIEEEIPWKVSINEAVEIAKVYWDDSSKKIVNWVLNKTYKDFENLNKIKYEDYSNITESCFIK